MMVCQHCGLFSSNEYIICEHCYELKLILPQKPKIITNSMTWIFPILFLLMSISLSNYGLVLISLCILLLYILNTFILYKRKTKKYIDLSNFCANTLHTVATTRNTELFFDGYRRIFTLVLKLRPIVAHPSVPIEIKNYNFEDLPTTKPNAVIEFISTTYRQMYEKYKNEPNYIEKMSISGSWKRSFDPYMKEMTQNGKDLLNNLFNSIVKEIQENQYKLNVITNGYQFEEYIARIILKNGFDKAEVTKKSGDFGADVIAQKDELKYAIQCKFYSQNVGVDAVQQVIAAKNYYQCHVAVVATNNYYTSSAKTLAECNHVVLWDRNDILKMAEKIV